MNMYICHLHIHDLLYLIYGLVYSNLSYFSFLSTLKVLLPFQFSQPSFINLNLFDINIFFIFIYTIINTQFINEK